MALVKCKECGNQVSNKARACPSCGVKVPKRVGIIGWLFVLFVVLPFAWSIGLNMGKVDPAKKPPISSGGQTAATSSPKGWVYTEVKDEMSGTPIKLAMLESPDRALFEFPYKEPGGSTLTLVLRKGKREGDEIYVHISRGQIDCGARDCPVNLKIGDGPIQALSGSEAGAGKRDAVFLSRSKPLREAIQVGRPFKLELTFYNAGRRTFSFDPQGLKWN
ncbi:hypothetical protein NNO07_18860 [Pseudomonas resinovorans]|uniref:Zinc-ribbon domain-containing protein n=1 Tax=Metapseudomonas resinovorans TaxID=53412 RepID=A0ABT4Y928_METRE|nr:zinc ribbon domain-containing protein [Pseudomonas resinovorans]MDA8485132.1 hypothetical protein [Pseudomonas resinovorans]